MSTIHPDYEENVFLNCPFDSGYAPLFRALAFAVHDAGFRPRCALEVADSGQPRLHKILDIISECRYSIHDVLRTGPDKLNHLPRFNMPLELGLDLGCRRFGAEHHGSKRCLILDREQYRYQKFISDIGGQDVFAHSNSVSKAILGVRNWLRSESGRTDIPGGARIHQHYLSFRKHLPRICAQLHLDSGQVQFVDLSHTIAVWLHKNEQPTTMSLAVGRLRR